MASRRVVIPVLAGIGNSLLAVPMVRRLKREWPDASITILARNAPIGEPMRRLAEVDEVIITGEGIKGLLNCLRWTWSRDPYFYLVPFPSNRWQYGFLAMTSFAKRQILHSYPIGYFRALGFIGERLPAERGIHDVVQNLRLLKLLGIDSLEPESPTFALKDSDRSTAREQLQKIGLNEESKFIAIHAGSATTVLAQAKRWSPEKYAQLIQLLRSNGSNQIVLLEGPDESGVADEIVKHLPASSSGIHTLKLTGPLGIAGAILERASLYVGSDSGLAHLAAAVGTKPITIFGPADPERVCPYGYRDLVVQSPKSCSPCFLYPWESVRPKVRCKEPMCISFIEPEMVMEAVRKALVPSPSGRGLG